MDQIPVGLLDNVGTVGMCVLIVIAYTRGWAVTGREHRERGEALKAAQAENRELRAQNQHLYEVGKTVEQTFRGLQAERDRDDQ